MPVYINYIGTSNPDKNLSQQEAADFMSETWDVDRRYKKKIQYLYNQTGIESRASVIEDYGKSFGEFKFYPNSRNMEPMPTVGDRMRVYEQNAIILSEKAVKNTLPPDYDISKVTHLITVSCTGMYAPGIDVELVDRLGMRTSTKRTAINFMGCYGAFNAMKTADQICKAEPGSQVLVVAVELCTIHFQGHANEESIVTNALFADGAAGILISSNKTPGINFSLENFYSDLIYQGRNEMVWKINDFGFEMRLTALVPEYIKSGIGALAKNLLSYLNLEVSSIDYFAIHPGGKKILEVIEEEFSLTREDNQFAYEVLKQHGNMSSPTVLFVLRKLQEAMTTEDHEKTVLSFAFGPGLTMESMLLKVCSK